MEQRGKRKVQLGVVTSTKMDKTVTVKVERRLPHPRYKKYYNLSKKFLVHDPENTCNVGDRVRIVEVIHGDEALPAESQGESHDDAVSAVRGESEE